MNHEIKQRYTGLAADNCCLSCGGAFEKSGATSGEVCIDLGCGRGTDVLRLAEITGPAGRVYGIDVTPAMISKGSSVAAKLGIANAEFILAELENIPLQDEIADLVISNCVINHVSRKEHVWMEIFRLLKKGGRFVVSDIYSETPVPSEYSSDPLAVAECWAGAVTRDTYVTHVKNAGFIDISIVEESRPYEKGKISVCSFTIKGRK